MGRYAFPRPPASLVCAKYIGEDLVRIPFVIRNVPIRSSPADREGKVAVLMRKGNALVEEAAVHVRATDPIRNPDGWRDENRKALDLFLRAYREGYSPAISLYDELETIPESILEGMRNGHLGEEECRQRAGTK